MNSLDLQSESWKDFQIHDLTGGSAAAWPAGKEIGTTTPAGFHSGQAGAGRPPIGRDSALSLLFIGNTNAEEEFSTGGPR
jgi:hypothetical protein